MPPGTDVDIGESTLLFLVHEVATLRGEIIDLPGQDNTQKLVEKKTRFSTKNSKISRAMP